MARPWRLRHKLVLGLALVVGSIALLLGGALFGLSSYFDTMRVTQRKLTELRMAVLLRDAIQLVGSPGQATTDASRFDRECGDIAKAAGNVRKLLDGYKSTLESEEFSADPASSDETALIARMEAALTQVDRAMERLRTAGIVDPNTGPLDDKSVKGAHAELKLLADDLFRFLVSDIEQSFGRSNANHRRSLTISASAAVLAVALILTLMYYFRVWIFAPIKALQAGVHRVHDGNFDQPIRLHSGDELNELADEFNAMTTRLRDIHVDLIRQVDEQSRQLVAAEKMVSVGFLAAGVAHEINNPLASIALCAEALERRLQPVLPKAGADAETIVKYLSMIEQESFRCKQITERLLNYSRSGAGHREPTDLAALTQNVLDLLKHHPASANKQMIFRPEGQVVATVDPHEVQGVVNNLVVNALENMDAGGTVLIALRNGPNGSAEFVVRDNGCGMAPEVLRHVFEPFYTKSRTGKGTGLGLFICNRVVTDHGGTIAATSEGPGRGSTFTVRLPLKTQGESGKPADEPRVLAFPGKRAAA